MLVKMTVQFCDAYITFKRLQNDKTWKDTWEEEFDTSCGCIAGAPKGLPAREYAQMVIDYFNDTLKPGEQERVLVSAEEVK